MISPRPKLIGAPSRYIPRYAPREPRHPATEVAVIAAYHGSVPRFVRRLLWADRRAWLAGSCRTPRMAALTHLANRGLMLTAEERTDGSLCLTLHFMQEQG